MPALGERSITIMYLPVTELPDETLSVPFGVKAGYYIHSDENGAIGYRIFVGEQTTLVPKENVHKIITVL